MPLGSDKCLLEAGFIDTKLVEDPLFLGQLEDVKMGIGIRYALGQVFKGPQRCRDGPRANVAPHFPE